MIHFLIALPVFALMAILITIYIGLESEHNLPWYVGVSSIIAISVGCAYLFILLETYLT